MVLIGIYICRYIPYIHMSICRKYFVYKKKRKKKTQKVVLLTKMLLSTEPLSSCALC